MLLHARSISKALGVRTLFSDVTLRITQGERVGLIGPNGAGKSTMLRLLAELLEPDEGQIVRPGPVASVYIPQADRFDEGACVLDVVAGAAPEHSPSHLEPRIIAEIALTRVGFAPDTWTKPASTLSGGWRKRLSTARALAQCANEPDLILLDEPTNHLDLEGIEWLRELLTQRVGGRSSFASVFVTHDRRFLDEVATRVVEISDAYPGGALIVDGGYAEFIRRRAEFLDGQAQAAQSLANQVRQDQAWLSRGAQGRRTKQKGRIQSSAARDEQLGELRARNQAANQSGAKVEFTGTDRQTKKLISAKGISKSFGERTLFSDLDMVLGVGDCVGLLGANGSGKTTLINVLTGTLKPDAGEMRYADPMPRTVVFSQHRQDFEPTTLLRTALCPVSDRVEFRGRAMHVTSWARRFRFRDEQLDQPVGSLSGGELARVHIARIMLERADVLVLDEPTNDLDIPTLELLEDSLTDFPGAVILVTHDREMLDRLASRIVVLKGDGTQATCPDLDQALRTLARAQAAQRDEQAAASEPAPKPIKPTPTAQQTQRKKLSYKDQRDLDTIEQRIEQAEQAAADAEAALGDPKVVADHEKMARACQTLETAQAQVATLYARWEELEAMRA